MALNSACVLVANRGECACRVIKSCTKLGVDTIAVYTPEDQNSLHTRRSTRSVCVSSYTDSSELVQVAIKAGASSIHPGWGFLSESPEFADACNKNNITFIGPTAANLRLFGNKTSAKRLAQELNVPVVPGTGSLSETEEAVSAANAIGYPVMLKASNGGGGISIYKCCNESEIRSKFNVAKVQAQKFFGDSAMFLEKCIETARHVEVQLFGDGKGVVVALGDRECSVQRRYQKILEESPALNLGEIRLKLFQAALTLGQAIKYQSVGTVEFLIDQKTNEFYFMEFNTRLQVEHGLTELCLGIDLVAMMVCQSYGCLDDILGISLNCWKNGQQPQPHGHAIQVRVYAEDPMRNFQPSSGVITDLHISLEADTRVDTGVYEGYQVTPHYDPMIIKVMQWASTRHECISVLKKVLTKSKISGPLNNVDYLNQFIGTKAFQSGNISTSTLSKFEYSPTHCIEVLSAGMLTTIQDWPGRVKQGLWRVGVPPSGAMDHFACRVANRLVGNDATSAVLEMCISGSSLKFHCERLVAVTGAPMEVTLDGKSQRQWESFKVQSGSVVSIKTGAGSSKGCRSYLSVAGGIDVPKYLDSRATFVSGKFGGHQGRLLQSCDMIPVGQASGKSILQSLPGHMIPSFTNEWFIGCLPGPYGCPDFVTPEDYDMILSAQWRVHHDSNRLGIRLIGPSPTWARTNGGEGGSHPSNVLDYVYAVGSVNFTGNMPIIITHDGPSLGGFVCPITITQSELWKVGQLKPGDTVQFKLVDIDTANDARLAQTHSITTLGTPQSINLSSKRVWSPRKTEAVLLHRPAIQERHYPGMTVRLSGDTHILVEYGPMVLDLNLRFRIHFLEQKLLEGSIQGLTETAPGVRSLQVRYNPDILYLQDLIEAIARIDDTLPDVLMTDFVVKSRILHLPMCFNHSGVDDAIQRYIRTVRKEAAYLPSNIDFIAQNNGLHDSQEVYEKVFSASYMCLGLGDVYLNSPCAVPINPLHRVVIPKYNPARTYTQEGTVGLGGAFMCIYAMDSPGGYQLVGRTLPIWNTYIDGDLKLFYKDKPWLFEMFDQIRFFPVTEKQLEQMRQDFSSGTLDIKIEETNFSIKDHNIELAKHECEIVEYQKQQQEAAQKIMMKQGNKLENECLQDSSSIENSPTSNGVSEVELGQEMEGVYVDMAAMVGHIAIAEGDRVVNGNVLMTLFAMKMEHSICTAISGTVRSIIVKLGDIVNPGQLLIILEK